MIKRVAHTHTPTEVLTGRYCCNINLDRCVRKSEGLDPRKNPPHPALLSKVRAVPLPHSRGRANQLETNCHQCTANTTRLCQEEVSLDFAYRQTLVPSTAHSICEWRHCWIILKKTKQLINKI